MNSQFFDFQIFAYPDAQNASSDWQGDGKSHVLVLHNYEPMIPEIEYSFLSNILKAVKLTPLTEQVFLGSCTLQKTLTVATAAPKYHIQTILLFGIEPTWAGIRAQLPYYQFVRIGDLHFLRAHSLTQIREERQASKNANAGALWNALKAKFL